MKLVSFLIAMSVAFAVSAKQITLNSKNTVTIREEISLESVSTAQLELAGLVSARGSANYTIYLVLDSPGGDIQAGLDFIEFAKGFQNVETVTLFAASMASAIVEALPGKRNIIENGVLMFHRAKGGLSGQFEDGELESRLNFYKSMVRGMEQKNASRLKMSLSSYKSSVKDELWILGSDSIEKNAADEIVNVICTAEMINKKVEKRFRTLFFDVLVSFSECPLIKAGTVSIPAKQDAFNAYQKQLRMRF